MAKHYKLLTNTRYGNTGEIVTAEQLEAAGADVNDLTKRNLAEATTEKARTDTPGIPTDEQNKINVENAIRDATIEQGKPLSQKEQDDLAAEVTADSGRPVRTDGKDVNKAEALQARERKAAEKAAAREARGQ